MDCQAIWNEAHAAGCKAWEACTPKPMIIGEAKSLFSDEIVPGTEHYVSEGLCGFAWVHINPARGKFITYCKKNNIGRKGTYGGWVIPARGPFDSQSIERKEAYAYAFSAVLREHGLNSSVSSRLD